MEVNQDLACVMVIFGGTGDLTYRKLMPALYNLRYKDFLPASFAVVSVGRKTMSNDDYRDKVLESITKFSRNDLDNAVWQDLRERIFYQNFDFSVNDGYSHLQSLLTDLDVRFSTSGNRIFYLAVAPEYFPVIVNKLAIFKLVHQSGSWQRAVIEKPFGRDLQTARSLNAEITAIFTEKNTYRIDHYLGKEMIQNIMVIRFVNSLFESVWNNKYIDHIQISSNETVGVESRGGYYERAGALRDMVQNHLLQLLTLIAMEPPIDLNTESIRDEKVKLLRSLVALSPEFVKHNIVRGQYGSGLVGNKKVRGYREEVGVEATSNVETFVALKLSINNFRWAGVPFYFRTGKRMATKSTDIVIQFKSMPQILYFKEYKSLEPNVLIIRIQPKEGVFLQINVKKPGMEKEITPVKMDFCQNCDYDSDSPEAYEKLLFEVMRGDSTLFTRWEEVENSWKLVDAISAEWQDLTPKFPNYSAGGWGPKEAENLIARDGRVWWN